jgi:hypothetical protein
MIKLTAVVFAIVTVCAKFGLVPALAVAIDYVFGKLF